MNVVQSGKTIASLQQIPFPPSNTAPARDYVGEYRSTELGVTLSIAAASGGRLKLEQRHPILELPPFIAVARDLFICDKGARIDFERDSDGKVVAMTIHGNRAWGLELHRVSE